MGSATSKKFTVFDQLPNEIICLILEFTHQLDLLVVLRVNKKLHELANSIIRYSNFEDACMRGEIITLFRYHRKNKKFYDGFRIMVKYNQLRLIKSIIEKLLYKYWHPRYGCDDPSVFTIYYDIGLCVSAEYGHLDMFQWFINKDMICSDRYLHVVCKYNKIEITDIKSIEITSTGWDRVLMHACIGGNINIVRILVNNYGGLDWQTGIIYACKYACKYMTGHIAIIKLLQEKIKQQHMIRSWGHLN